MNEDRLALAETDRFGYLADARRIRWTLYGRRKEKAKAPFAHACKGIGRALRRIGQDACDRTIGSLQEKAQG
ncbi:hypothetical protein [Candidatus Methylacidithermus pantelleriae]|uniref:Uncharacterized protein n=1 Tax=Candidatus Methylacidithermus pantelleriae TaxID=2744239 RepID=A0A8J2FSJ7_9BACT|nr:hypothetical protein [Candidatus Methylacidithermus pantelleriae]CAF0698990.1 hypothetical protein MPNT_30088 [Candidatus Methylacidithermus pantelleriae]